MRHPYKVIKNARINPLTCHPLSSIWSLEAKLNFTRGVTLSQLGPFLLYVPLFVHFFSYLEKVGLSALCPGQTGPRLRSQDNTFGQRYPPKNFSPFYLASPEIMVKIRNRQTDKFFDTIYSVCGLNLLPLYALRLPGDKKINTHCVGVGWLNWRDAGKYKF